jgi:hypothetical protein
MGYMEEHLNSMVTRAGHTEEKAPQLVKRETVASADSYMIRLLQLGAIEGALGEMDINPLLKPVIEAMHHVLTGGEVEIKVLTPGNALMVQELNHRLEQTTHDLNLINQRVGYSVQPRT